ncbi:MAG: peptide-methionine (S)-S-oxide reductase MsrA [Actinomycetia bacterium]|nr:peptide-methionine (S)-S-oxide reductase MsrA [Actinomycetes bacterium]
MKEIATFGAGCFWGVEETFGKVPGVITTSVGYTGGHVENVGYKQVCSGNTGHAESVQVEFDPSEVSFDQLLNVFWKTHNPTTKDRQGPDFGSQYRSAIFYHSPAQKAAAEKSKEELEKSGEFTDPIVTEITPAPRFYRAEDYHQKYFAKKRGA